MSIQNVLTLLGGVALFLFGMSVMGSGLEKMSGGRLERILERMTSNLFKGVLLGMSVTAVIQSSSATTVMAVGFVNAGIMKLSQVVGVIMGANIGTTVTALLLGLGDISSGNIFISLLKPVSLAPVVSVIGIVLYMIFRGGKKHNMGQIFLGFGILFFGMLTMEGAVKGLAEVEGFRNLMTAFSNPFLGLLMGTVLTAVIQSSSASVGILQAMSASGAIPFSAAAPIILGQNIGTCITAILSSLGASRNAKRTALIHLYFNVIGSLVFLAGMYAVRALIGIPFWESAVSRTSIAIFHLTFNVVTTLLWLPFSKTLVKLATISVRGGGGIAEPTNVLDERFLSSPSIALDKAASVVVQMTDMAITNFKDAVALLAHYDDRAFERIRETEEAIDRLEVRLNQYLLRLVGREFTQGENARHSELLHTIGDIERVGDYAINIAEAAQRGAQDGYPFSTTARTELNALALAVGDLLAMTRRCYAEGDAEGAMHIEPLEETVDLMTEVLKSRHIERLKSGVCSVESGSLFLELLMNFERISDHCSNVALYVIQSHQNSEKRLLSFDIHEYAHHLHEGGTSQYSRDFAAYEKLYFDPIR